MTEAQIKNAKGIRYLVKRAKSGGKFEKVAESELESVLARQDVEGPGGIILEVWEERPNVQAYTDLMNRALDKPKEQEQEHKVAGELVIRLELPPDGD